MNGNRQQGGSFGVSHSVYLANGIATDLAYVRVLADELQGTTAFLSRPVAWFLGKGFSLHKSDHGQGTRLRPAQLFHGLQSPWRPIGASAPI